MALVQVVGDRPVVGTDFGLEGTLFELEFGLPLALRFEPGLDVFPGFFPTVVERDLE